MCRNLIRTRIYHMQHGLNDRYHQIFKRKLPQEEVLSQKIMFNQCLIHNPRYAFDLHNIFIAIFISINVSLLDLSLDQSSRVTGSPNCPPGDVCRAPAVGGSHLVHPFVLKWPSGDPVSKISGQVKCKSLRSSVAHQYCNYWDGWN